MSASWQPVIGLEIHVRLKTTSKLFSRSSAKYGAEPNTQASAIDLAMPGTLPSPNAQAVRMAIAFGLAVDGDIAASTRFARKHYFYPDLPKGYQISQFENPIVSGGRVRIDLRDGEQKVVRLTRAHLEEDAGKLLHDARDNTSYVDLNRAGTPLIEVVSEPELFSATEATAYMRKIYAIVRDLDICDGNMQEGSFRCDANVSIRRADDAALGVRNEIKNVNSFRFVEKAINYEIQRQIGVLESGGCVTQQTRLYDADKDETRVMRDKEDAHDYRYFPDPDLPPVEISAALIDEVRASMAPSLEDLEGKLSETYGLSSEEAATLSADRALTAYFEACASATQIVPATVFNWVTRHVSEALKRDALEVSRSPVSPQQLAQLLDKVRDQTLSDKMAREVFATLWRDGGEVDAIIREGGLEQVSDESELSAAVARCCAAHAEQVEQYRAGKTKVLGFLVGKVMQDTAGKANPAEVSRLLKQTLDGEDAD